MKETCRNCGGDMMGDGYSTIVHCESVDRMELAFMGVDEGPVYCMTFVGLTFNEYFTKAMDTAFYPRQYEQIYPALKLAGEAGEVAEKVGKCLRDKGGVIGEGDRKEIAKELGDVLWYVAAMCRDLDIGMAEVASMNLAKLASRKSRGMLGGSGDNR